MKNLFTFLFIAIVQIGYSQKLDCTDLKIELQNIKSQNTELTKQFDYYKETLNLLKSIKSLEIDGLQIDIVKIIGSSKDKTLKFEFIFKNITSENRTFFQCEQAFIIDPQGNQYQTYEIISGANKNIRVENIKPNIPYKGTILFRTFDETSPTISELQLKFYSNNAMKNGNIQIAIFENLEINWQ